MDDHGHLKELARIKNFDSLLKYTFYEFSTNGQRFISMLTFGLQASSWPNPFDFKLFNLILHLVNSLLIYWLVYQLAKLRLTAKEAWLVSTITTLLWLFAPIHIFSTFYVIQRMTLLSVFFTLLGCNLHIYLRSYFDFGKFKYKPYFILSVSISLFILAGVFSKENGILLCLFILIIETAFLKQPKIFTWRLWKLIFLWGPLVLLVIYLQINHKLTYTPTDMYPFTSLERLMNQAVILWHYVYIIIIPQIGAYSLTNDDIEIIRQWSDSRVIVSLTAHIIILTVSFKLRKTQPVLFWGVFWFYGGHILESSILRLELYYDHRNYLPSLGIYAIIAFYSFQAWGRITSQLIRSISIIACFIYFSIYCHVLYDTAFAFSSNKALVSYQFKFHPDSRRAQIKLANYLFNTGYHSDASLIIERMIQQRPDDIPLQLYLLLASDISPDFELSDHKKYEEVLTTAKNTRGIDIIIYQIFECITKKKCKTIDHSKFRETINLLKSNPNLQKGKLYELLIVLESKSYSLEDKWHLAIKTLESLPQKRISRIDFYFILLRNQFMIKDIEGSKKTIATIESKLKQNPVITLATQEYLNTFKNQIINIESQLNEKNNE
ncbi:MAG: hypothetical protein IMY67_10145 [Bacteroidetes bacterium]|nr:hypothetical protein [Bacteroidota bacterium]